MIPKSKRERIIENAAIFHFALDPDRWRGTTASMRSITLLGIRAMSREACHGFRLLGVMTCDLRQSLSN
jgi:hypothetical protein